MQFKNSSNESTQVSSLILPDFILPTRQNQTWSTSGIDSFRSCRDKSYFLNYQHGIEYRYNSRGFRDSEWPVDLVDLKKAIWCIGDSFTVGIGQPYNNIWPQVLHQRTGLTTINVSMDGASNEWIARKAIDVATHISPKHLVVMWSYTHRRESADLSMSDELRRLESSHASVQEDLLHWLDLSKRVKEHKQDIVQVTIPRFSPKLASPQLLLEIQWQNLSGPDWPVCPKSLDDLRNLPARVSEELITMHKCYDDIEQWIEEIHAIDTAISRLDVTSIPQSIQKELSSASKTYAREKDLLHDLIFFQNFQLPQGIIYLWQQLDWARDGHHFDVLTAEWICHRILRHLNF